MSSRWNQNSSPFNEDVNSSDPTISFKALLSLEQEIQQNITLIKNEEPPKISYSERQSLVSKTEKLLTESYTKTKEWKKKANQRTYEKMRDEILQQVRHHILEINNLKNLLRRAVLKMRLDQVEEYEVKRRQMLCSDGHTDEVPSPFAPRKSESKDILRESKNVTRELILIRSMMKTGVSYGQEIIGELDNQGHEIDATIQELREIQGTVSKGRYARKGLDVIFQ
ncbi:uncharacterized protein LOC126324534 isoform X2 [Schistocerca gregaria]|uniref:uncharacterized protein LOC126324534 isoform X2 n=1 Tax=Schistocerca gregaria TaxID=7010 RepID=UPI00211EE7B8|nr:uncharacterized protein LOC126324534 isoform X2 [Schistocerca gregaria]